MENQRLSTVAMRAYTLGRLPAILLFLTIGGCALPGSVQRESVEYNTAVAGMANQLTLLNIVRAEEDLPIFYTSVSRLSGSTIVTASGGFNAQIKASAPTDSTSATNAVANTKGDTITSANGTTTSLTTAAAPSGTTTTNASGSSTSLTDAAATTAATTVTNVLSHAVTSGGNIYTPSLGGQVVSGPSFDINILDTQLFYQGILTEIPFSTVDNYIDQDYDNQLLMRLLIDRLEFRLKAPVRGFEHPAGTVVKVLRNAASGDEAGEFANEVACFSMSGLSVKKSPKLLAPVSRITSGAEGKLQPLTVQELAAFDGEKLELATLDGDKLDLDGHIRADPALDQNVLIVRPSGEKRVPQLKLLSSCAKALRISDSPGTVPAPLTPVPVSPPGDTIYAGQGDVIVLGDDGRTGIPVAADIQVIFRSPEGVIRFLGKYLYASQTDSQHTYRLGAQPLFSIGRGRSSSALVTTEVLGTRYYIADDVNRRRNMTVLALVEQLVNLQKSATDRPVAVPVHVVQ